MILVDSGALNPFLVKKIWKHIIPGSSHILEDICRAPVHPQIAGFKKQIRQYCTYNTEYIYLCRYFLYIYCAYGYMLYNIYTVYIYIYSCRNILHIYIYIFIQINKPGTRNEPLFLKVVSLKKTRPKFQAKHPFG